MNNNLTELVLILDRSGSMGGMESDTIGGFNSLIRKQRSEDGDCVVTTVLFDHEIMTLHDRLPLSEIREMTEHDYTVRGCTALIDAIGTTVGHIEEIHRYIRPEDVPAHTMFVIITDGMENASRRYGSNEVKRMIEQKKACGWEFLFIGANIDAVQTAAHIGIDRDRAVDYRCDSKGTGVVYRSVCRAVGAMRKGEALAPSWNEEIKEDYRNRP